MSLKSSGGMHLADDTSSQLVAAPTVRFIRDIPADDDFFKTHTRVATAIVRAIEENPEIKVIGLLGRWGSGKSTVANKVVELLEAPETSVFKVFPYDAWLHQSDPLRRSFLESLILTLVRVDAIAPGKWMRKLNKLNRPVEDARTIETPVLSSDARWLALSLLAVPIALGFLGFETLKAAFGAEATPLGRWTIGASILLMLAPGITWLVLYASRRPWGHLFDAGCGFWKKTFWQPVDAEGEPVSAFQIFVQGPSKQTDTRTFRSNEPTSLEFGRMFQKIAKEVRDRGHRLVILIDNLDRVDQDEALGMWATIRSFFLASNETDDAKTESFHPTVILPIDRHAVEDLFAGGDQSDPRDGRDRARSFMDKTFDVTFEVTEPVHSDWRDFLAQQMEWMFGAAFRPSWAFWTRRLFESELARPHAKAGSRPSAVVTPREINKLLNRVGALYLQWAGSKIPVEVMALYVIRRDDIDGGVLRFMQTYSAEIAEVAPDWKRQLAALHYGVEPDIAAQVLLAEPIREAIIDRDQDALKLLSAIPGFGDTFEYATSDLAEAAGITPFDLLTSAIFLLQGLGTGEEEWKAKTWRTLVNRYGDIVGAATPPTSALDIVKLLSAHVPPETRETFVTASAELLSRLLAPIRTSVVDESRLRAAAEQLIAFAKQADLPAPTFNLDLDPKPFITRVSDLSVSPTVWRCLRTDHSGSVLSEAVAEMLGEQDVQRIIPPVVRCLTLAGGLDLYDDDTAFDFESVAERAEQVVRDPGSYGGHTLSGIKVLADLSFGGHTEGEAALRALVDDGIMATRLNEAVGQPDWEAVATIVTVMLWRGSRFDHPTAFTWYGYPQKDPEHLKRIVTKLNSYFPNRLVPILWDSQKAGVLQSGFVETLIGYAIEADALGEFDTAPVLANLSDYVRAVPWKLRDRFFEQVDGRSNLLAALPTVPLGPQAAAAAEYLRRKGGPEADQAAAIVRARVEQADAATWAAAVRLGKDPFDLAKTRLKAGDLAFPRKSGLYEALAATVPDMTETGRETRLRWFTLVDLMKPKPRKALLEALGRALEQADADQALAVLKIGGVQFLKAGGFTSRATASVQRILVPQLAKKDGRTWLKDNKADLSAWVQKADPATRASLASTLVGMAGSKQSDRRYSADILVEAWSLKPL